MENMTKEEKLTFIDKMKFNNKMAYLIISFNQGIGSISDLAVQYYFKDDLKIEPARLSQIFSLILIPWTIKPIFGMITDLFPIFGYRRKNYIILCGIINVLCWLYMSFLVKTLFESVFCLLIINICLSFSTVLGEAIVVELSKLETTNNASTAKDYVSLFFFCKYVGALLSSYLKGLFVELMSIRTIFFISAILPWMIVTAGFILVEVKINNHLKEEESISPNSDKNNYLEYVNEDEKVLLKEKSFDNKNRDLNLSKEIKNKSEKNKKDVNYNILESKEEILEEKEKFAKLDDNNKDLQEHLIKDKTHDTNENKNTENLENSYHSIFFPSKKPSPKELLSEFVNFICQKYVLVPTIFIFVFMATPAFGDPFFYFLTNELKFTASSLGKISFFTTAGTLIAIWLYRTYFTKCNFRILITIGTIISFIFTLLTYLLVKRVNKILGISDFFLVLFSSSFLSMLGELIMMPMLSLACLLCPKNLEGTVYAFFLSALNLGGVLSNLFGSIITTWLRITSKDYHNLDKLILISNIFSLAPLPFLLCISDSYFDPELKEESENEKINDIDMEKTKDYELQKNKEKSLSLDNKDKEIIIAVKNN